MTLRHAAALALVGWYLITPPLRGNGVDFDAPISNWEQEAAFDTAAECENAVSRMAKCGLMLNSSEAATKSAVQAACGVYIRPRASIPAQDKKQDRLVAQMGWSYFKARCVATDDPRLKEK